MIFRQTFRSLRRLGLALLLFSATAASTQAAPVVIDNFDAPNAPDTFVILGPAPFGTPNPTRINRTIAGPIGGQRDVLVNVLGTARMNSAVGFIGFDSVTNLGLLQLATAGTVGSSLTLQYDGIDVDPIGPPASLTNALGLTGLDQDLTGGGINDRFLIRFLDTDGGNNLANALNFTINMTSATGTATWSGTVADSISPTNKFVPFSAFTTLTGSPSFSQVTSVSFVFNPSGITNVDFEIDSISTVDESVVPEPSGLVLGGLALAVSFGAHGWRRRMQRSL